jgi:hypothetical protein
MEMIWGKPILTGRWAELIEGYELYGFDYSAPEKAYNEFEAAIFAHAFKQDSDGMIEALGSVEELVRIADRLRTWLVPADLPEELTIAHGGPEGVPETRINWTTSIHVAETFAKYEVMMQGHGNGEMLLGKVRREDVIMALPEDIEAEIAVRPGSVKVTNRWPVLISQEQIIAWREAIIR